MSFVSRHNRLLITLSSAILIAIGTLIAIKFARGYRPTRQGTLKGIGLLAASSDPTDAYIYLDGEATGKITNETLSLSPGSYQVEIKKDGFATWQKQLQIAEELVTTTNAHLFRNVPSLTPLTFSGARVITPSPDGQRLAFTNATSSAELKPGLYLLELSDRPGIFSKGPRLIAENPPGLDYEDAQLLFSPDSTQILASFGTANYLLPTGTLTRASQLADQSPTLSLLLSSWEDEIENRHKQLLLALPNEVISIATSSAKNLYFSPDGEKLLYTATTATTIPEGLIPPLPSVSTQPEARTLIPGNTYIYDSKEDKNFLVYSPPAELPPTDFEKILLTANLSVAAAFSPTPATGTKRSQLQDSTSLSRTIDNFRAQYSSFPFLNYQWFPTSNHILINQSGSINIIEYDAGNLTTLYQGAYEDNFVIPWPGGSKLVILTNLTGNPNLPPNLYTINLK